MCNNVLTAVSFTILFNKIVPTKEKVFLPCTGAYAGGGGVQGVQTPPPLWRRFFCFFVFVFVFLVVTPEVTPLISFFGTCATFEAGDWRKPPPL